MENTPSSLSFVIFLLLSWPAAIALMLLRFISRKIYGMSDKVFCAPYCDGFENDESEQLCEGFCALGCGPFYLLWLFSSTCCRFTLWVVGGCTDVEMEKDVEMDATDSSEERFLVAPVPEEMDVECTDSSEESMDSGGCVDPCSMDSSIGKACYLQGCSVCQASFIFVLAMVCFVAAVFLCVHPIDGGPVAWEMVVLPCIAGCCLLYCLRNCFQEGAVGHALEIATRGYDEAFDRIEEGRTTPLTFDWRYQLTHTEPVYGQVRVDQRDENQPLNPHQQSNSTYVTQKIGENTVVDYRSSAQGVIKSEDKSPELTHHSHLGASVISTAIDYDWSFSNYNTKCKEWKAKQPQATLTQTPTFSSSVDAGMPTEFMSFWDPLMEDSYGEEKSAYYSNICLGPCFQFWVASKVGLQSYTFKKKCFDIQSCTEQ